MPTASMAPLTVSGETRPSKCKSSMSTRSTRRRPSSTTSRTASRDLSISSPAMAMSHLSLRKRSTSTELITHTPTIRSRRTLLPKTSLKLLHLTAENTESSTTSPIPMLHLETTSGSLIPAQQSTRADHPALAVSAPTQSSWTPTTRPSSSTVSRTLPE